MFSSRNPCCVLHASWSGQIFKKQLQLESSECTKCYTCQAQWCRPWCYSQEECTMLDNSRARTKVIDTLMKDVTYFGTISARGYLVPGEVHKLIGWKSLTPWRSMQLSSSCAPLRIFNTWPWRDDWLVKFLLLEKQTFFRAVDKSAAAIYMIDGRWREGYKMYLLCAAQTQVTLPKNRLQNQS